MRKRAWISICALIVVCAVWYAYEYTGKNTKSKKPFQKNVAQLLFVPEPSKVVPSWLDNGNGMVLSVTMNKWEPTTDNNVDYYVIVPTTTDPSNTVSMYDYPDGHAEPKGFNPTWGVGPDAQTNAINAFLSQHSLATLNLRAATVLTPRGNTQNINFDVVIENAGGVKLEPNNLRLAVIELEESGDDTFKVLGGEIFSSDGTIQMLTKVQH